jgi:hypothetical protein
VSMLSERGVARREERLEALKGVVRRRGRRRVMVRAAGALVVVVAVGLTAVMMVREGGSSSGGRLKNEVAVNPVPGEPLPVAPVPDVRVATLAGISLVKTDPMAVREYSASPGRVARLDDAGLQEALREAGEPAGIVRIGKRVMLEGELGKGGEGM